MDSSRGTPFTSTHKGSDLSSSRKRKLALSSSTQGSPQSFATNKEYEDKGLDEDTMSAAGRASGWGIITVPKHSTGRVEIDCRNRLYRLTNDVLQSLINAWREDSFLSPVGIAPPWWPDETHPRFKRKRASEKPASIDICLNILLVYPRTIAGKSTWEEYLTVVFKRAHTKLKTDTADLTISPNKADQIARQWSHICGLVLRYHTLLTGPQLRLSNASQTAQEQAATRSPFTNEHVRDHIQRKKGRSSLQGHRLSASTNCRDGHVAGIVAKCVDIPHPPNATPEGHTGNLHAYQNLLNPVMMRSGHKTYYEYAPNASSPSIPVYSNANLAASSTTTQQTYSDTKAHVRDWSPSFVFPDDGASHSDHIAAGSFDATTYVSDYPQSQGL